MQRFRCSAPDAGRVILGATLFATCLFFLFTSLASAAAPYERWRALSEREKTFIKMIFAGDEAKAVQYAEAAGINVNAMAGEPLSAWFYRMGNPQGGAERSLYRELNVQRIVFECFKQNPNPPNIGETYLGAFCNHAPVPQDFALESRGTPDQIRAFRERQDAARKPHIEAMAAGFDSLTRYGLKDRQLINSIFRGCVFKSASPLNAFYYDTVLSRMIRAGADVNIVEGGERPLQLAIKNLNADLTERLVRDGAAVTFSVNAQCGMNAVPSNLYGFLIPNVRTANPDNLVRLAGILANAKLPPTTKATYVTANGYGSCVTSSLYDAAIDAGLLDLAKRIKEAGASGPPAARLPMAPAASQTGAVTAPDPGLPAQFGGWRVANENGRLTAVAKADGKTKHGFAALRLECVGGRLEYVPIALKIGTMTSLWVSIAGDAKEMKLVNQRAAGPSASTLSQDFLASEAAAKRGGLTEWGIEMGVEGWDREMDNVVMTGFSQARSYMLTHCKA